MSIRLIVPSRGRPGACADLLQEFHRTKALLDTEILFALDDDDPELPHYQQIHEVAAVSVILPRLRMVPTLNMVALSSALHYDVLGFMGDDHRPRTVGWDQMVAYRIGQNRPGVVYGNDLVHGANIPTAAFVSADMVRKLGYMAPPGLIHMYADNFWKLLGETTQLHYLDDMVIEHLHPIVGKAQWSDQYAEVNGFMEPDRVEYERFLAQDWPADRAKLGV